MYSRDLHVAALAKYAESIRNGTATLYECIRFVECNFLYKGSDAESLTGSALKQLLLHDPYYLLSSVSGLLIRGITETDVDAIIREWTIKDSSDAAFLEGYLRLAVVDRSLKIEHKTDQLMKALTAFENANDKFQDDIGFLKSYTKALGLSQDPRFNGVYARLLAATDPEWRPSILVDGMGKAVTEHDWDRFDELRVLWGELPSNAHFCECHTNYVANIDGLRAIHNGNIHEAIKCLHDAAAVSGCPHLNSGSACLLLAEKLIDSAQALDEVRAHLSKIAQFCPTDEANQLTAQISNLEASV